MAFSFTVTHLSQRGLLIYRIRELEQTTTAAATRTQQNKRFYKQNNDYVRAFRPLQNNVTRPRWRTRTSAANVFAFPFGIERCHCLFSLSTFVEQWPYRRTLDNCKIRRWINVSEAYFYNKLKLCNSLALAFDLHREIWRVIFLDRASPIS